MPPWGDGAQVEPNGAQMELKWGPMELKWSRGLDLNDPGGLMGYGWFMTPERRRRCPREGGRRSVEYDMYNI